VTGNGGTYRVREDVIAAHLEGEAVLLDLTTRSYFRLNDTAAAIWRGMEQGSDRSVILQELCSAYAVERDEAAAELERVLGELQARGLIVAPAADPA
jgi:hypothetical protein